MCHRMKDALDVATGSSLCLVSFGVVGEAGLPNYAHADLGWTEARKVDHETTPEGGVGKT